jgi:glycosyltransferase involved in cell wall biosynthesis
MTLSVVILTKNEEKNLEKLLPTLALAEEVVIVDDNSVDKTLKIAEDFGARVYKRKLDNDFAAQRNFGLEKATGNWILFLDTDEEISKELSNEITQLVSNPLIRTQGYHLKRQDFLWGKLMTGTEAGRTKLLRLIKKGKGKWARRVHEYIIAPENTSVLKNNLIHYPHTTLGEFIKDINYYSTIHAEENRNEGKKASLAKIIFYPAGKFINNWLILGGYKDGGQGFVVSLMMSLHSFLSWSKLWLMH